MAQTVFQKTNKSDRALSPQAIATAVRTSSFFNMGVAHAGAFVIVIGAVAAALVAKVLQGTASGATGGTTKAILGKTATYGTAHANSLQIIEVEASELDVANLYKAVALQVTAAGAGGLLGAAFVRTPLRYEPASLVT